ncbi:hypothetical protein [Zoogloea sp.]|uniref:hypothetical protein n=1 Tax=Zoogloea sp. TaxID=49181 RepID=UPI00263104BC|nr:hypothetical protein [Zoogloea sp.]
MLESILEIIAEFLLQAILEIAVELGLHALTEPLRAPPNPWLVAVGYAIFGATIGGLSLWPFPSNFVQAPDLRITNLVATPVVVGALMSTIGSRRSRRGQQVLRIDRFAYGYVFALSLALVRFWFAV